MNVEIYTRTGCGACRLTTRALTRRGVTHATRDLDAEPELVDELKARGFTTLPVVRAGKTWWSGYRPDRIATLAPTATPAPYQSEHVDDDHHPRAIIEVDRQAS